jgi:hypothetical protein
MKLFHQASRCIESIRFRAQLRKLPHRPLDILRIEVIPSNGYVSCDLLIRQADARDRTSGERIREQLKSRHILLDALALRLLVLQTFPEARAARVRVFRQEATGKRDLVLTGNLERADGNAPRGASPALQARLCGFSFILADGLLCSLATEDLSVSY